MPEDFIIMPDGKPIVVFETDQHPDFPGTFVNIQTNLKSDIPSYIITADNIAPALNKKVLSIFSNLSTKRIRVQQVYVYPRTLASNTITLQLKYINSVPTGGSNASITKCAFDFPNPPAAPNNLVALTEATASPVGNTNFGGTTFNLNTAGKYIIFEPYRNASALQIRPGGVDGLTLEVINNTDTSGTFTTIMVVTLD